MEFNPFSLKGKTILVTGASSGIGRGIAIQCSKLGGNVLITGRNEERLKETFNLLEGEGLIGIRSRELKLRLLDMNKVNSGQITWQVVNVVLPSALMIVLGIVLAYIRKKKYNR